MIANPFFVSCNKRPTEVIESDVYILCLKQDYKQEDISLLRSKTVDSKAFNIISRSFSLIAASNEILDSHKEGSVFISTDVFKKFCNSKSSNKIVVIPFYDLREKDAQLYASMYTKDSTTVYSLEKMLKLISIIYRYKVDGDQKLRISTMENSLSTIVNRLKEAQFWEHPDVVKLNMTKEFRERRFSTPNNYKFSNLMPIVESIKKSIDSGTNFNFTKKQTTGLFQFIKNSNDRLKYNMFNAFLMSESYCHLVLDNPDVLDIMSPIIETYKSVYRILFGYAWLAIRINNKGPFSLDSMSKLPVFDFIDKDVNANPYSPTLVSTDALDNSNNFLGLPMIVNVSTAENIMENIPYGIVGLTTFKRNISIYATGNSSLNIFKGLDVDDDGRWKDMCLVGESIFDCCKKFDPRVLRTKSLINVMNSSSESRFKSLCSYYFKSRYIHFYIFVESVFDYIERIEEIFKKITRNIAGVFYPGDNITSSLIYNKSLDITVTEECLKHLGYDDISSGLVKEDIWLKYANKKIEANKKYHALKYDSRQFKDFYIPTSYENTEISRCLDIKKNGLDDENVCYLYLNELTGKEEDKDIIAIKFIDNINYRIISNLFKCTISFWKEDSVTNPLSENKVSPRSRCYYNNKEVMLYPDAVTALMTNTTSEYNDKDNKDNISKVQSSKYNGIGTLLNEIERDEILDYWESKSKLQQMINNDYNIFSRCELSHKLFKPNNGMNTYNGLQFEYRNQIRGDRKLNKIRVISDDGSVVPFDRTVVDSVWS